MASKVFVDTNVLIYSRDERELQKRAAARQWLDDLALQRSLTLNLQVLNELSRWLLRRHPSRPVADIRDEVEPMRAYGSDPLTIRDVSVAWEVRDTLGYQWFDCLLIAAAATRDCRWFLTEDMADGARFRGVTIIDPFRHSPAILTSTT